MSEIQTCAASLLRLGLCCNELCGEDATFAVLDGDLIEHARCDEHKAWGYTAEPLATKPLVWDEVWKP